MKKAFLLFIVIIMILSVSCSDKYHAYQIVKISKNASIMVPNEWVVTVKDSIIYMTDKPISEKSYKIYLLGWDTQKIGYNTPYKLLNLNSLDPVFEESNSLGVLYGEGIDKIKKDNNLYYWIEFQGPIINDKCEYIFKFIGNASSLEQKTVEKISNSFQW